MSTIYRSTATRRIVHEEEQYDAPKVILKRLKKLEAEIASDLEELEAMWDDHEQTCYFDTRATYNANFKRFNATRRPVVYLDDGLSCLLEARTYK